MWKWECNYFCILQWLQPLCSKGEDQGENYFLAQRACKYILFLLQVTQMAISVAILENLHKYFPGYIPRTPNLIVQKLKNDTS